ncbi:unnamed protein product [Prorocentrum cordatum]|uniref:Uncharacterized protein n=1 Tax=Prorocentrum cordatum TaxID=2364126 RepID=A0ABN9WFQ2_9DINO|nr:unnamed protein product [Polarella glacialis]
MNNHQASMQTPARRGGQSLMKYLSRAKTRESSFWVMTITAEDDENETEEAAGEAPVQHLLLVELYNQMGIIHQAEGPHPRRWPRPDAWRWLQEWAAQEASRNPGEMWLISPLGEPICFDAPHRDIANTKRVCQEHGSPSL